MIIQHHKVPLGEIKGFNDTLKLFPITYNLLVGLRIRLYQKRAYPRDDNAILYLMEMLQLCRSGECRASLHFHYSQLNSDTEW